MLVKCTECGAHVPRDTAVNVPGKSGLEPYCSAACVDSAEREGRLAPETEPPRIPEAPTRILVPTDGSGPALRAVERAVSLARLTGGRIELIHVVGGSLLRNLGWAAPAAAAASLGLRSEDLSKALREGARAQLERSRRLCEAAGVPCKTRVVDGPALDAILDASGEADLVVMGSRGLDALSGTVLGSLSQRVIASAKIPVMVVH